MEQFSSTVYKSSEEFIQNRNLLFSMDYDSGYISHNPESNSDYSTENSENTGHLSESASSKHIYLSEDALLETPKICKYPNLSEEIENEDFEETRNILNSPILSVSATHVSGSTASGCSEIIYSGFDTEDSTDSLEIPCAKSIVLNNSSLQNLKNAMYNMTESPDLQDLKREAFKNVHQNKTSVFNNITNTLATTDPKKKLTLIFSKNDKENVYSVKRKFHSLTPPNKSSDANGSLLSQETSDVSEQNSILEEEFPESRKDECLKCAKCNADISEEYTSFEDNINNFSESDNLNESSIYGHTLDTEETKIDQKSSNLFESVMPDASDDVFRGFKTVEKYDINNLLQIQQCFVSKVPDQTATDSKNGFIDQSTSSTQEHNIVKQTKNDTDVDVNGVFIKSEDNWEMECRNVPVVEKSAPEIMRIEPKHEENLNENSSNVMKSGVENSAPEIMRIEPKHEENSKENSSNVIKSVVSETLQDVLNNLIQREVQNHLVQCNPSDIENEGMENSDNAAETCTNAPLPQKSISTPEKSYTNPIDSSLSPDLFTEDLIEEKVPDVIQPSISAPKEKNVVKKDYMILRRTQNNLKGVLPPRSLTIIKMSIAEMLNKIECNEKYFWNRSTVTGSKDEEDSKSLLITSSLQECKKGEFPGILKDRCLGLYHNRSKFSEEFEELCVKYGQRYVGAETQSSCTVFETNSTSPTKRRSIKPQWNTKSPGKRLSHLARRRITFSSANLQSGSSFLAGSRARQILVDAKKIDLLSRRKSPRKTPKKTPRKSPRVKTRTPSSSAKKKLAMRFRKVTGEIEKSATSTPSDAPLSAKRTLFHSPDEKPNRFLPSTSGSSALDNETKKSASKRALFMSPSKSSPLKNMGFKRSPVKRLDFGMEKKRKRTDFDDELPSKFSRCNSEIAPITVSHVKMLTERTRSEFNLSQNRQIKELTTNHKKKLQLAIYEALRSQNILPTHPKFKIFASNLGRLTRKLFLVTSADYVGVTEKMLRIARYHVISVVKGKAPEDIYEEVMKQKLKTLKPQGYVAPAEPLPEKSESDRRSSFMGKPSLGENKIERIRKAINFGDDDNR